MNNKIDLPFYRFPRCVICYSNLITPVLVSTSAISCDTAPPRSDIIFYRVSPRPMVLLQITRDMHTYMVYEKLSSEGNFTTGGV